MSHESWSIIGLKILLIYLLMIFVFFFKTDSKGEYNSCKWNYGNFLCLFMVFLQFAF